MMNHDNNNVNELNNEQTNDKVVGMFLEEQDATQAIEQLKAEGFSTDQISVIAKDKKDLKHISEETGTKAPEGIATGATAGGLLGGTAGLLAGLGMMAIPVFGPIMAAGPIVVALTGAAVGAGAGGLVGGLIGLGIPEDEAAEYENNVKEGQILVLVDKSAGRRSIVHDIFRNNHASNSRFYNRENSASPTIPTADHLSTPVDHTVSTNHMDSQEDEQTLRLREEQLEVSKHRAQTGEVEIRKEVIEEQKTINVPVTHEEVVIERKAVTDGHTSEPIGRNESIRIPVSEEKIEVSKRNVVTGEVEIHKQNVQSTEQVQDTVKREEARVTRDGEAVVNENNSFNTPNRNQ